VTHAIGLRMRKRARQDGPSFGLGIGVAVPIR